MNPNGPPAIFFHPDAIEGAGRELVGRRSAGLGFLKGWLAYAGGEEVRAVVDTPADGKALQTALNALGEARPLRVVSLRTGADLTQMGAVFFPTPGYQRAAWQRLRRGPASCSLIGITHTVSTRRIVEALHHQLCDPVEPWDAIICTSEAVKTVVATQYEAEAAYFRARFGATRMPQPRLPVIPLGVQAAEFVPRDGGRQDMRAGQGTPEDAVVVMTMGRFSAVEKANPIPLMLALEQAAARTVRPLHLWLTGWASRPEEEALHREAAALCPNVTVRLLDGRAPDIRRDVWAGADIFTLPADSIQETYGLAPVEAMAAGLPVVVPDWDGFRDTIRHGVTGLRVPTRMAPPGAGAEIARRFADGRDGYVQYLALVQAQVQVDVPAYAEALTTLIADATLRQRMGAAGRAHVAAHLDWRALIPRYLDLARELTEVRAQAEVTAPGNPLEIDPFTSYRAYPTTTLEPDDIVAAHGVPDAAALDLHDRLSGRVLYSRHVVPTEMLLRVWSWLDGNGPATVRAVASALDLPLTKTLGTVLILAKSDMVRLPDLAPAADT